MKISEIIIDKYKLRIEPNVYYDLLADVREAEEEQEPCDDAVSRHEVAKVLLKYAHSAEGKAFAEFLVCQINDLPPVNPQETVSEFADRCRECGKMKRCRDCKYFEYNSVAKVDGVPLIVAHEICSKWGDGCKTSEDGYCFLFEPKEEGIKHG